MTLRRVDHRMTDPMCRIIPERRHRSISHPEETGVAPLPRPIFALDNALCLGYTESRGYIQDDRCEE